MIDTTETAARGATIAGNSRLRKRRDGRQKPRWPTLEWYVLGGCLREHMMGGWNTHLSASAVCACHPAAPVHEPFFFSFRVWQASSSSEGRAAELSREIAVLTAQQNREREALLDEMHRQAEAMGAGRASEIASLRAAIDDADRRAAEVGIFSLPAVFERGGVGVAQREQGCRAFSRL